MNIFENPIEPVLQTNLKGQYVCGKRGGESIENAIKPVNNKCPNGTKACTSHIENTIC